MSDDYSHDLSCLINKYLYNRLQWIHANETKHGQLKKIAAAHTAEPESESTWVRNEREMNDQSAKNEMERDSAACIRHLRPA